MKQHRYMLETPSMLQYVKRDNLIAADNQQATERAPQRLHAMPLKRVMI